jgi:hypothetical protein
LNLRSGGWTPLARQKTSVTQDLVHERRRRDLSEFIDSEKFHIRQIIGRLEFPANDLRPTVNYQAMLGWRVYDLVNAELILDLDFEAGFLLHLSRTGIRYALERMNLPARYDPRAPLRVFVSLPQQDPVCFVTQ